MPRAHDDETIGNTFVPVWVVKFNKPVVAVLMDDEPGHGRPSQSLSHLPRLTNLKHHPHSIQRVFRSSAVGNLRELLRQRWPRGRCRKQPPPERKC